MAVMGRTGTKSLLLKKEGFELHLEQHGNGMLSQSVYEGHEDSLMRHENALQRAAMALSHGREMPMGPASQFVPPEPKEEVASVYVTSPMVGTVYLAPSPDDAAFVKIGDRIEKGTVVCIIEAMKVMNEVKAGVAGTVAEILVESGQPVEFGSKIFRIT